MSEQAPPRRLFELLLSDLTGVSTDAFAFIAADGSERWYTRAELGEAAETLGRRIGALGDALELPPDALVAILASKQEDQVLHYLGVLAAGRVPAILTPPNRKLDRAYFLQTTARVLERTGPGLVLTDLAEEIVEAVGSPPCPVAPLGAERLTATARPGALRVGKDAAVVQFSSGTTGIKKGVALSEAAVRQQLDAYGTAIALRPRASRDADAGDCVVSWLPLYHDMGFMTALNMPLAAGVPVAMLEPIDWVARPGAYFEAVHRHRATLGWHPNFAYAFLARRVRDSALEGVRLDSLRGLANCSEPVTHAAQQAFMERFAGHGLRAGVMSGCYAMAETAFSVTHGAATDEQDLSRRGPPGTSTRALPHVTVGTPLPGVTISARDESGAELPDEQVGELWVQAPFTADGYVADPAATTSAFANGWYKTGDLGYRRGDRWYVTGRKKDLLIVAGENVYPEDVEAIVSETPGFRAGRAAAFAEWDAGTQTERVVILAEPEGAPEAASTVAARQRVNAELSLGSFTLRLVPTGWLVKSSAGKIARAASATKWREEQAREQP
jgi:acyl-CoA synthetase (AMP-forming)/AMP-acid ligase II